MTSLLLENCRLVATQSDARDELRNVSIRSEDGWITQIGATLEARETDRVIDGRRFLALPGLINTHHHLYQTLTRGFPESEGQGLFDWLAMLYPVWAGLDDDMIYDSTRLGLAELALAGCTTCADHLYVFPPGSQRFMDRSIEAAISIGLRFHPTRGSMDLSRRDGGLPPDTIVQKIPEILEDSERVLSRYHDPSPGSMLRVGLAPCSPFSASSRLMRETAELARAHGVRLHTHIAETRDEEAYSRRMFGRSPVALLDDLGWVKEDVWLAHCVHPDDAAIQSLAEAKVAVAHCPSSNMLLGSGIAPVRRLLSAGVTVGLGVDGSASNDSNELKTEVKQSILASRLRVGEVGLSVREAVWIATRGGAACLGRNDVGSLEVGKVADIVLFDLDSLACAGGHEDPLAITFLGGVRAHTTIVAGEVIVQDGRLCGHDPNDLASRHNESSRRLLAAGRTAL